MTTESHDIELVTALRTLGDRQLLRESGVDQEWAERCVQLVAEFKSLRRLVAEMETKLSAALPACDDDTIVP